MPTFSGNTIVALGGGKQIGIEQDNKLPDSGALTWKPANTPTDLAGTTGIDCKLVHGDFYQVVDNAGQLTTNTQGDETHTIQGSMQTTVNQDEHETVGGVVYLTVTGGWQEEQQGPVNQHYLQAVTTVYDQDHDIHQPDSMAFQMSLYANTWVGVCQIGICSGFFAAASTGISATLSNLDLEAKTLHAEGHGIHGAWAAIDNSAEVSKNHASALKAASSTDAHLRLVYDCLADLNMVTPFG